MKKILLIVAMSIALFFALEWKYTTAEHILPMEVNHPKTTSEIITYFAKKYKVSEKTMRAVIKCESGFNPNAVNNSKIEYSVGLVQINLRAHKHITVAQAKDPVFAINFLAKNLSQGKGRMWTCYTKLIS